MIHRHTTPRSWRHLQPMAERLTLVLWEIAIWEFEILNRQDWTNYCTKYRNHYCTQAYYYTMNCRSNSSLSSISIRLGRHVSYSSSCTIFSSLPGPMGKSESTDSWHSLDSLGLRSPRDCAQLPCVGLGACNLFPNGRLHHSCSTHVSQPVILTATVSVACRLEWSYLFLCLCQTCPCPCLFLLLFLLCLPCLLCRLWHPRHSGARQLLQQRPRDDVSPRATGHLGHSQPTILHGLLATQEPLLVPCHVLGVIMNL